MNLYKIAFNKITKYTDPHLIEGKVDVITNLGYYYIGEKIFIIDMDFYEKAMASDYRYHGFYMSCYSYILEYLRNEKLNELI
jgi:hypothetical protein